MLISSILMALQALLLSLFFGSLTRAITLPPTLGRYKTSFMSFPLTDSSRLDPFAPSPQPRRIMVSLFTPLAPSQTCQPIIVPYMDPQTAAFEDSGVGAAIGVNLTGFFETIQLQSCSPKPSPYSNRLPLLLFSTGFGTTRLFYSYLASSLASTGYVVALLDSPYDADIVVFPDGTNITRTIDDNNDTMIEQSVAVRAADELFLLKTLTSHIPTVSLLSGLAAASFNSTNKTATAILATIDPERTGLLGHSLGGATSLATILLSNSSSPPILAGANFDGAFFFPPPPFNSSSHSTRTPFLLFTQPLHNQSSDPTLAEAWSLLKGPKIQLSLDNSTHGSFTDFPILADASGIRAMHKDVVDEFVGSISGVDAVKAVVGGVGMWMDEWVKGKKVDGELENVKVVNGSWY